MSSKSCAVICFCPSDRFILPPTDLICLYLDRNNNQIAWYYTSCELKSSLCVFQKTVPTISTFYIFVKMMTRFKTKALGPTCLVPHVLLHPTRSRAPTRLVFYVLSFLTRLLPCLFSCPTCLVPWELSCLTHLVPYLSSCPTCFMPYVFLWLTCLVPYVR